MAEPPISVASVKGPLGWPGVGAGLGPTFRAYWDLGG